MLAACWRRPDLLLIEVGWRWTFGIPAIALLLYEGMRVLRPLPLSDTGILNLSLQNPPEAAQQLAAAIALVTHPVLDAGRWIVPLLAVAWSIASGLGRSLLFKRMDRETHFEPVTLMLLQLLRFLALAAACAAWWFGLRWAANLTLGGAEPNLIGYSAWAICLSLGAFTVWALVSWIFFIAPLVAMLEGRGVTGSLARSFRLGKLTGKLVEVNLVLGIVKLALIVLAMVFSAIPLPFAASMTGPPLYLWWALVTLFYLVVSDFFQVARLAVFVEFWSRYYPRADASVRS
jgi:hypothetical protein